MRRTIFGLLVLAAGAVFLMHNLGVIDLGWFNCKEWRIYFWPVVIMLIGLKFIFGKRHHCSNKNKEGWTEKALPQSESGSPISISVAFAGDSYNYTGEEFSGAKIAALFGGVKLDLRQAKFESDVTIDAQTMFGGIQLLVPSTIKVIVSSHSFIGGVGNHTCANISNETRTLYINANCLCGGIDIKN